MYFFSFRSPWAGIYVLYLTHGFIFVSLTIDVGFVCYIQQSRIYFRFAYHWSGIYVLYLRIIYFFSFRSPCVIFNNHVFILVSLTSRWDLCAIFNIRVFLIVFTHLEVGFICYI